MVGAVDLLERRLAAVGLLVGVGFGLGGSMMSGVTIQTVMFAVSSVGWVIGTAILAARRLRASDAIAAAGFFVLTVAECLLWVSGRPGTEGYAAGFGGGTMFYVPALALLAGARSQSRVSRTLAALSAIAWAVGSFGFLDGSGFTDTDPQAIAGYVMISAFFVSVAVSLLREPQPRSDTFPSVHPAVEGAAR